MVGDQSAIFTVNQNSPEESILDIQHNCLPVTSPLLDTLIGSKQHMIPEDLPHAQQVHYRTWSRTKGEGALIPGSRKRKRKRPRETCSVTSGRGK